MEKVNSLRFVKLPRLLGLLWGLLGLLELPRLLPMLGPVEAKQGGFGGIRVHLMEVQLPAPG